MHCYNLEINILFGLNKWRRNGIQATMVVWQKKAQQENENIDEVNIQEKNEPKKRSRKSFMLKKNQSSFQKAYCEIAKLVIWQNFLATTTHLYVLRVQMCNVYWKKVILSNFFSVKWGKSGYCFDSCVATTTSFEKYQEKQDPR